MHGLRIRSCGYVCVSVRNTKPIWVPRIWGVLFQGPYNKDYAICGNITGTLTCGNAQLHRCQDL